ncbi:MAG: hypothetical protein WAX89_02060, partial [Alphaproteobacteria bacterium]
NKVTEVMTMFQKSILTIQDNMVRISGAISQQGTATHQITQEITENAARAGDIMKATDQILVSTKKATSSSDEVKLTAMDVAKLARDVNLELDRALGMMRAAM